MLILSRGRAGRPTPPPSVVAGAAAGLGYAFLPGLPLELLGWVWMVPLLLALRTEPRFSRFYGHSLLALLVLLSVAGWWLLVPSITAGVLAILGGALFMSVPWLILYALRAGLGWRVALWGFPLVWMAWEPLVLATPLGPAWNVLSFGQGRLWWLVQFADVTGPWGITGWLVLVNVALTRTVERWQAAGRPGGLRTLAGRGCGVLALLLLGPLIYSAVRLATLPPEAGMIRLAAVQPSVPPRVLGTPDEQADAEQAALALAATAAARHPDLLVLPEAALSGDFRRDAAARLDLYALVARTGVPVLTGTRVQPPAPASARTPLLRAEHRTHFVYNAAALVTPPAARRPWTPADTLTYPNVYLKRRLIPFVEGVPYTARYPALTPLALYLTPRGSLDTRTRPAAPLFFRARNGQRWGVGVLICYEQFYPSEAAEAARQGAALLVAPSNESWFAQTNGAALISIAARLRAIETRRTLVRATNTGVTGFVDARGRPYGAVPPWTPAIAEARVALRSDQTFYVRHPDLLPRLSQGLVALLLLLSLANMVRGRRQAFSS